jgi:hypothetical protein
MQNHPRPSTGGDWSGVLDVRHIMWHRGWCFIWWAQATTELPRSTSWQTQMYAWRLCFQMFVKDVDGCWFGWPQALQQDNGVNQQELPISAVAMRLFTDCFPILFRAEDGSEIAVELKLKQIFVVLDAPRNAYRRASGTCTLCSFDLLNQDRPSRNAIWPTLITNGQLWLISLRCRWYLHKFAANQLRIAIWSYNIIIISYMICCNWD